MDHELRRLGVADRALAHEAHTVDTVVTIGDTRRRKSRVERTREEGPMADVDLLVEHEVLHVDIAIFGPLTVNSTHNMKHLKPWANVFASRRDQQLFE